MIARNRRSMAAVHFFASADVIKAEIPPKRAQPERKHAPAY
jgi:hypothetical protein